MEKDKLNQFPMGVGDFHARAAHNDLFGRQESIEASKHQCHVWLETSWEEKVGKEEKGGKRRKKLNANRNRGHKTTWTPRLTYQFTHGHFTHIAMNTVVTLFTGIPLEGRQCSSFIWLLIRHSHSYHILKFKISKLTGFHGTRRIIIVFESSIICGGLWHMAWRWGPGTRQRTFSSHFGSRHSTGHMTQLWSACLLGAMHWWKLAAKDNTMQHTVPKLKTRRSNDKRIKRKAKSIGKRPYGIRWKQLQTECKFMYSYALRDHPRQCTWLISSWIGLRTGRAWSRFLFVFLAIFQNAWKEPE